MKELLAPGKRRWFIVAIIFVAIVFNYVDRQIVSILKPMLKNEFSLDNRGYAMILNVFTVCYALMYPVTGWMVDKFGGESGDVCWHYYLVGGLHWWRPLAVNWPVRFFRGLLGAAEPTNFPAQLKVITVWFPGKLRATANSLCVAGSSVGAILAPPVIAWLALTYNWKVAFIVMGGIGMLIAIAWKLVYRDPPLNILQESVDAVAGVPSAPFSWRELWGTRTLWGILLIRFVSDPVWYFCLFWLPGYLQEKSGLTLAQVGMFGWIPFLAADLGAIATSAWSDKLVRRGHAPLRARKLMLTCVAALSPLCVLTSYLGSAWSTLLVFSLVAIACLSWLFTISVVVAEAFPVKNVASVLGIAGGFGALGAVLFNYFVGQFIGTLGAEKIFLAMAFLHPLAVLILWTMTRREIPHKAFPEHTNSLNLANTL